MNCSKSTRVIHDDNSAPPLYHFQRMIVKLDQKVLRHFVEILAWNQKMYVKGDDKRDIRLTTVQVAVLVLAWHLNAQSMGYFKKEEFTSGMTTLG